MKDDDWWQNDYFVSLRREGRAHSLKVTFPSVEVNQDEPSKMANETRYVGIG